MKGEVLSKTEFETGIERPHAQFRQINKNKKGNYLVPLFATSEVREIAPNGQLLNSVKLSGTPFPLLFWTTETVWLLVETLIVSCN